MENCLNLTETYYKDMKEYEVDVDKVIINMITKNERLVFAVIAEKSGVTRFVVRQYPELRNYILQRMVYFKEMQVINEKIDKAVDKLVKSNKKITFMSIVSKCKLGTDIIYQNQYVKDKIRTVLAEKKG